MTAPTSIDPARFLHEQLASASPDLLRSMLTTFINTLMSRGGRRGLRRRLRRAAARSGPTSATATGTATSTPAPAPWTWRSRSCGRGPTSRTGCWSAAAAPSAALTTVVATCYLLGVSTRRMEKLVESLGITRLSKSQVSRDGRRPRRARSRTFRTRPLDAGPVHVRRRRRAGAEGPRGRPGGQRARPASRPASTPTGTGRSSACRSPPPRTAPAGWGSSAT